MNRISVFYDVFKVNGYYFGLLWTKNGLIASSVSKERISVLTDFYNSFSLDKFIYKKSCFKCKDAIKNYFNGGSLLMSSIIDHSFLSTWQSKVSMAVCSIPYGKTASYKEIALLLSNSSPRAVGVALKLNKLILIVPCHRIINHNGTIGGFSRGLTLKKYLLSLEKVI